MNSFISNSKNYCFLFFVFYFLFFGSFIFFIIKPHLFYWRAWEFITEVSYQIPHKTKWKYFEHGAEERDNPWVKEHHARLTTVSCNKLGYRTSLFKNQKPIIVVSGDSNTWGSNLSDNETVPWLLAEFLNVPVWNLGKFLYTTQKHIKSEEFSNTKIIVEIPLRGHLWILPNFKPFEILDAPECSAGIGSINKNWFNYTKIHPNRYFLLAKIVRSCHCKYRLRRLLNKFIYCHEPPIDPSFGKLDIEETADLIAQISDIYKEAGYQYVFGVIPDSGTIKYTKKIPEQVISEDTQLAELLKAKGVHYVDIAKAFRESNDRPAYFLPTDSHISPIGAQKIADLLGIYLHNNFQDLIRNEN